uniref:PEHE domain-containing protein n=1 Tax=Heterorhabditis bacteriophora TaxID=37862 RepID=A0A1I7XRE3_HETBA
MNINPFHTSEHDHSIDDKLANLHHEMATLRIECDRLINKHLMVEKTLKQNCIICPNQESSSAYNTGGESCRSNSITPDGTMNTIQVIPSLSIVLRDQTKPRTTQLPADNVPMPKFFRSTKLRDTLYMFDKPVEELTEWSEDGEIAGPSERVPDDHTEKTETVVHFKWKVKRRCDGTRYIVKRPIRSQVLKKREAQLNKERTGVSTDDDALSELKLGHFHTREERKKHLEKERQRKIRLHQKMIDSRMTPDQTIVHLSQRKMQRKKERMLLDGFVTTAEVLSQRNPDTNTKHGLLSVTTV